MDSLGTVARSVLQHYVLKHFDKYQRKHDTTEAARPSMSTSPSIRGDSTGSWSAIKLSNNLVGLSVVPAIGGRVVEFCLGDKNMFYLNPRHHGQLPSQPEAGKAGIWTNYGGSKVWPGPQGWSSHTEWPGPPDPVLDSGPYEFKTTQAEQAASVHLKSQHDEYSGITLERNIQIGSGSSIVRLHHTMRNTSRRPVRWCIWQVTQVDAAEGLEIFAPADKARQILGDLPYRKAMFDLPTKRWRLSYDNQVAKFAVQANQGWFAALDRARGMVFLEMFPVHPGAEYPDGAPTAFWISGKGTFTIHGDCIDMSGGASGCDPHVETEVMGPLTSLEPGESSQLQLSWGLAAIDAKEIIAANHCGVVGKKLTIGNNRVGGSFAVFSEAQLQLLAFDRASQLLASISLGAVSPSRSVVLDEKLSLPSNTARCTLELIDESGYRLGVLDHVQIR